jgi:hypothetical protein
MESEQQPKLHVDGKSVLKRRIMLMHFMISSQTAKFLSWCELNNDPLPCDPVRTCCDSRTTAQYELHQVYCSKLCIWIVSGANPNSGCN